MILALCCWLQANGHQVSVVTCREGWLAQRLGENRIETHVLPQQRLIDIRLLLQILQLARKKHVDVLHAHEFPMVIGLAPAAVPLGLPLIATLHGRERIAARGRRRIALRFAGMGCHRVIAVSQALRRFLVQDVQVPNTKVQTIYNGIDVEQFSSKTPREQFRQSLGIPSEARVIGTVGSLYPVKGQTHLLQAMAQVVKRVPTAVCLIVGRGELLSTLQQQANELQLGERVKFLGFRSDVAELLSLMEVFILPSLSEGLPLSLLEAQAAGKPVVASRVGGNPEVVENGKTGFLVPPSEPDMLAERIVQLLENPSAAIAMGERGRLRMRQIFSLEAMGRAYLSLFMSYMNGSAAYRKTWVD